LELEEDPIKASVAESAPQHEGCPDGFKACGLFIIPDQPYLAAPSDGIFTGECCGPSPLEVRCPYSVRFKNLHLKGVYKCINFQNNATVVLKSSIHRYYTQKQAQMWVKGVDHDWFVVWTQRHKPLIERIAISGEFCASRVNSITIFYKACVLPCHFAYRDLS